MPLSLEPDIQIPIVLATDMSKPAESRPTFFVRALSMRDQLKLGEEIDSVYDGLKTLDAIYTATCDLLSKYMTGWKNMGQYVYPCDMQTFLHHSEAKELLDKLMLMQHVSLEEKKS
jgi:hypothetical protein